MIGKVFSISNQKGGVGKTSTALNLGVELARAGYEVLFIDNDPQMDLTNGICGNSDIFCGVKYSTTEDLFNAEKEFEFSPFNINLSVKPMNGKINLIGSKKTLIEVGTKDIDVIFTFK